MLDEIVSHRAFGDAGTGNDEGDVRPLVGEELLAAGVADSVIGHENHERFREEIFFTETRENESDMVIG